MVACITLCNSACITCIWCFLLSLCFPKFVQSMEEKESSEFCARKFRNRRRSSESLRAHEIARQREKIRESDDNRRKNRHCDASISPIVSSDPINVLHRGSKSLDSSESAKIERHKRRDDPEVQKRLIDPPYASRRDSRGKYKLYAKLSRVASGLEERLLEKKRSSRGYFCNKPFKYYRRCENDEFRNQRNSCYNPKFLHD